MDNFAMKWREKLPDGCPPDTAMAPPENAVFYRIVETVPPTNKDFFPMVKENPKRAKQFAGKDEEFMTYGVSLFDNINDAKRASKKVSNKPNKCIVEVRLSKADGVILRTGGVGHWTWWMTDTFNFDSCKKVVL